WLAAPPAEPDQIIRRRGEHIGRAAQKIARAIAVVIDGVLIIFRWHHLGLAELAGPRTDHVRRTQIAALDEAERVEQLGAKAVRAPAVVSERSERAQCAVIAHIRAEVAFQRPERNDDRGRHAELRIDFGDDRRIGLDQGGAALNAIGCGHSIGKFRESLSENTLAAIDIHDALIVSEVGRGGGNGLLRNALRNRLAFELGEPFVVSAAGAARRGSRAAGKACSDPTDDCAYRTAPPHSRYQLRMSSPVQYSTPSNLRA